MMLWSEGSLSPSVIFSITSGPAFGSLLVIFLPAAMFFNPAGTIMAGPGLSESGSTFGPIFISLGVPLKAGAGNLISSGTNGPPSLLSLGASPATTTPHSMTLDTARAKHNTGNRNRGARREQEIIFISFRRNQWFRASINHSRPAAGKGETRNWAAGQCRRQERGPASGAASTYDHPHAPSSLKRPEQGTSIQSRKRSRVCAWVRDRAPAARNAVAGHCSAASKE